MIAEMNMAAGIAATAPTLPTVQILPAIQPEASLLGAAAEPAQGGFLQSLQAAVHKVDGEQHAAQDLMTAVDSGQSDDLVGAMLSSQQAGLSFNMLMQVRNKVAGALDDLLKLQL